MKKIMYIATSLVALNSIKANMPAPAVVIQPMPASAPKECCMNHDHLTGFKMGVNAAAGYFSATYKAGTNVNGINLTTDKTFANFLGTQSLGLTLGYSKAVASKWAIGIDLLAQAKMNIFSYLDNPSADSDNSEIFGGLNLAFDIPFSYLISNKMSFDFGPSAGFYACKQVGEAALKTTDGITEVTSNVKTSSKFDANNDFGFMYGSNVGGFIGMSFAVGSQLVIAPRIHVDYLMGAWKGDVNGTLTDDAETFGLNYTLSLNISHKF